MASSALASSPSYVITPKAYTKIVLHAAKYPASSLLGLLIGRAPASGSGGATTVEDIVPLVHKWTTLSPVVEAGCALAEAYAAKVGLTIVGCYEAPARVSANEREPSPSALRLAQRIATRSGAGPSGSGSGSALLCLINNVLLLSPTSVPFLAFVQPAANAPSAQPPKARPLSGARALVIGSAAATAAGSEKDLADAARTAAAAVQAGQWSALADFDDHLGDPQLDWLENASVKVAVA